VEIFIYKISPLYVSNPSPCMFQLTRALRDLPVRIQTASKKERSAVLENVVAVLSNPGTTIVALNCYCVNHMPNVDVLRNDESVLSFYQQCKGEGEDLVKNMTRW